MTEPEAIRIIAVDWSGSEKDQRNRIWLAEAGGGQLRRLECGRTRDEIAAHLKAEAALPHPLFVGLDFAFSFPAWYLSERGLESAVDLWHLARVEGETWIQASAPPFWGRPGKKATERRLYRQTEIRIREHRKGEPKSAFQVAGAGTVGAGSILGMPLLLKLREAGFSVWPFDEPRPPVLLEIYPRVLTGPVRKGDPGARRALTYKRFHELHPGYHACAMASENAFDAMVSALEMDRHAKHLTELARTEDPNEQLEGRIWDPAD
jgi:hypothetical protein